MELATAVQNLKKKNISTGWRSIIIPNVVSQEDSFQATVSFADGLE